MGRLRPTGATHWVENRQQALRAVSRLPRTPFDRALLAYALSALWGMAIAYDASRARLEFAFVAGGLTVFYVLSRIPSHVRWRGHDLVLPRIVAGVLPSLVALYFLLTNDWTQQVGKALCIPDFLASFRQDKKAYTIPMASDPNFQPLERTECRRKLGLPDDRKIIGYGGSVHRSRGIDTLFQAYEKLKGDNPQLELVLTGRNQKGLSIPSDVRWLGYLPDEDMPLLLNSLDVLLVLNRLSDFGKFSYPVNLYEAMRCHIPVVATNTPPVRWILGDRGSLIAEAGDDADLARKVKSILNMNRRDYGEQNTWAQSSLFEAGQSFHHKDGVASQTPG